jgi:hypothetical protein
VLERELTVDEGVNLIAWGRRGSCMLVSSSYKAMLRGFEPIQGDPRYRTNPIASKTKAS